MSFLLGIPAWLGMILIVGLFTALACGGHWLVHRTFKRGDFIEHNEVAGFIIAVIGVIYAVVLGFVVVIVWEQFNDSEDRVRTEITAVNDAWRVAGALPAAERIQFRTDIRRYVDALIDVEWPAMRQGRRSPEAAADMAALVEAAASFPSANFQQSNVQLRLLDRLQIASDNRRRRLDDNRSGVAWVLWAALFAGAAVLIGFLYLFGMRNFRVQLMMTAAVAIAIGTLFTVIVELDFPFRGDVAVTDEGWVALRDSLR